MNLGTLVLVCGLPGSGKTTLAKKLQAQRRAIRLCPDDWIESIISEPSDKQERDRLRDPVENLQWELTQDWLQTGLTVILENGFWSEEERSLYAVRAIELGAAVELHVCLAPLGELWRRIEARSAALESPLWVMSRKEAESAWLDFEPPTDEELAFYDDSSVTGT